MSIPTIKAGNRSYKVTTSTELMAGFPFLEIGPAGTTSFVSTLIVQFKPDENFAGDFVVMGRTLGTAADSADVPFVPIPYRVVSLNDVAQDYSMVSAPIAGSAMIQIPANGMSVALLDGLTAGSMQLTMWDLQGGSAI